LLSPAPALHPPRQLPARALGSDTPTGDTEGSTPQRSPCRPRSRSRTDRRGSHADTGAEFELQDTNVVGRFDRATGYTPEVDLSTLDTKRTLSRRHASITRDADGWHVSEPKPTGNGTFVNDARVGAGARIKLSDGDRLRFGLVETVFSEA
jgi:pSer/pThr/pTyr-binding forkhead associated (FHA) protein